MKFCASIIPWLIPLVTIAATIQEADTALRHGEYPRAIELYKTLVAGDPGSYEALFGLARAQAFSGRHDEAITTYTRLLEFHPGNADARLGRGRVLMWSDQIDRAEEDLRGVVETHPAYADAWSALGDLYLQTGRYPQATEAYLKWAALEPDNPESRTALERVEQAAKSSPKDIFESEHPCGTWRYRLEASYTDWDKSREDWLDLRSSFSYRHGSGSVGVEGLLAHRFGDWDEAVGLDVWQRVGKSTTVHGEALFGVDPDFLARWDAAFELYQSLGRGWELGGGYRHMDFDHENVDIYYAHGGKYFGPWYARYRASFSPSVNVSIGHLAALRYYFNDCDFAEIYGTYGEEDIIVGKGAVSTTNGWSIGGRMEKQLAKHLWLTLGLGYGEQDPGPAGTTYSAGFILAF